MQLGRGLSAATKTAPEGYRYEERWFNDGTKDRVRLWIINGVPGLYVFIGTRDGGDTGAEAAYQAAVSYATESAGNRRESIEWEATVCQVPATRGVRPMGLRIGAMEARDLKLEMWGSVHSRDVPTWYPRAAAFDRVCRSSGRSRSPGP